MKRIIGLGLAVLVLAMALPLVSADESLVGVVYKAYTKAECLSEFSVSYVTNDELSIRAHDKEITHDFALFKGPLTSPKDKTQTNCYCDGEYIMRESKDGCVKCITLDSNAVYYTDDSKASDTRVNNKAGQDVGCRCAATKGTEVLIGIKDGICSYGDASSTDQGLCNGKYPNSIVCPTSPKDTQKLGSIGVQGRTIECCCKEGDKKEGDKCVSETGTTKEGNEQCAAFVKGASECPSNLVPKDQGGTRDDAKASQEDKWRYAGYRGFKEGTTDPLNCCCPAGKVAEGNECVDVADECTQIFGGTVKKYRTPQGDIEVNNPTTYQGKVWDPVLVSRMNGKNIKCMCQAGHVPVDGDKDGDWDQCAKLTECRQIFLGSVDASDKNADPIYIISDNSNKDKWKPELITQMENAGKECACPKGTIPSQAGSGNGVPYEVCAIENMNCMSADDLAKVLKVGICKSIDENDKINLDLSPFGGPVAIVDDDVVSVSNGKEGTLAHLGEGIGYGFMHSTGLNELRLLDGCGTEEDNFNKNSKSFPEFIKYVTCMGEFDYCYQMPALSEEYTGLAAAGRLTGVAAILFSGDEKAAKTAVDDAINGIANDLDTASRRAEEAATKVRAGIREASNARATGGTAITEAQTAISGLSSSSGASLSEGLAAYTQAEAKIARLESELIAAGVKTTEGKTLVMLTKMRDALKGSKEGLIYAESLTTEFNTLASGGATLIDDIADFGARTITIESTRLGTIPTVPNLGVSQSLTNAVSTPATITGDLTNLRSASYIDDVAEEASKLSRWGSKLKNTRFTRWLDNGVMGKLTRGLGKTLKFAGKVAAVYTVGDFIFVAISETIASDLDLKPGIEQINRAKVDQDWSIKIPTDAKTVYVVGNLQFSSSTPFSTNSVLGGALSGAVTDIRITSTISDPPPVDGGVYKCACDPQCNANKLSCKCWPISNSVDIDYKKNAAASIFS